MLRIFKPLRRKQAPAGGSFTRAATNQDLHDLARLILNQGCRPEELMAFEWCHITRTHMKITRGITGAAKRTLLLTAESRMILDRRSAAGGRWVFPSPKRPGQHLVKLNGAHDTVCSPKPTDEEPNPKTLDFVLYDWRHTFATRSAQAGMDLATLARILGHSSLRMVTK